MVMIFSFNEQCLLQHADLVSNMSIVSFYDDLE